MSRLFIVGAGFSKAIANAPLANNMLKYIWQRVINADDDYRQSGDWQGDRSAFLKILFYLHDSVKDLIQWLERDSKLKIINKNFEEFLSTLNIEFICSFLDLLSKHSFIPKSSGVDLSGCQIPFIHSFNKNELESALKFINHHLLELLLLDNPQINTISFNKMSNFFSENDTFISFNYDLLLEKMLWQRNLWNPYDGYGFEFDRDCKNQFSKSKTKVIKIHGSINWRSPSRIFHPNLELAIVHPFKNEPLFEGMKIPKSLVDKSKFRPYPLYSYVILPTFLKSPQYSWEIQLIEKSIENCQKATEIYILGYSAPDADYITNILFNEINKIAKVFIVLWDNSNDIALNLRNKLIEKYNLKKTNIIHENTKIEEWIQNDFKYLAYANYLENQKFIDDLIKYSKNKKQ